MSAAAYGTGPEPPHGPFQQVRCRRDDATDLVGPDGVGQRIEHHLPRSHVHLIGADVREVHVGRKPVGYEHEDGHGSKQERAYTGPGSNTNP